MATAVELYLDSKNLDYLVNGDQAEITPCPFCGDDRGSKFFINLDNWLYNCHAGVCGVKGNEKTFKRKFGDVMEVSNFEDEVAQVNSAPKTNKAEPIPDIEAAHQKLLEDFDVLNWLNDERGYSLETIKAAKLGVGMRRFGPKGTPPSKALLFPYFENGICVGVKFRSLPPEEKDFRYTAGREPGLYGQDVIKEGMEYLCLLEGESDSLALRNAGEPNVVGVPGCDGKKVTWDEQLHKPKKKYLLFDNDEAGQKGALSFATRFGIDQFHNVVLPPHELDIPVVDKKGNTRTTIKDVNEFFANGYTLEEFNLLLENARPFDIEGVTTMDSAFETIIKQYNDRGSFAPKYAFKWDSLTQRAKGIDDGDMVVWLAPGKAGKTTACLNQCEFMLDRYNLNPHFDCMEMEATELTQKWTAMRLVTDVDKLTLEQMHEGRKLARSRTNTFNFTRSRPTNLDDYLQSLIRMKRRYDSGVIVIDNFQILVDLTIGRNNTNNRPSYMSQVSKSIKALAGELKVPIFLISQPKQLQEGQMVGANDSEGSSTLTKDCDLFITLNRNPEATMKIGQMASLGNFETNQSHSDDVYVQVALSRRSAGGYCTLKIDGAKSIIREYNAEETPQGQKKTMIAGITFVDATEETVAV
jgi:hypothetical protein